MMLKQLSISRAAAFIVAIPSAISGLLLLHVLQQSYQLAQNTQNYTTFIGLMVIAFSVIMLIIVAFSWLVRYVNGHIQSIALAIEQMEHGQYQTDHGAPPEIASVLRKVEQTAGILHKKLDDNTQFQHCLNELQEVFATIQTGGINQRIRGHYPDALVPLKQNINHFLEQLEVAIKEIRQVTEINTAGNLTQRINVNAKLGFMDELAQSMNKNFDNHQNIIVELRQIFAAIRAGDLSQTMQQHYIGALAELKQDVSLSIAQLNAVVSEIKHHINSSAQGVFDSRINVNDKSGFFKELSESVNKNLEVNQSIVQEIMRVFSAVAQGDLTQTMTAHYSGNLAQLRDDINSSVRQLNQVMTDIQSAVHSAGNGIFDKRVDTSNKKGFFSTIAESLNQNLDTNQKMVEELMRVFSALAVGDLTQTMQDEYGGRLAELKKDVNETVAKLNSMMANIGATITEISNATEEVAQGSLNLSQRTEEQAAALEETASSMQEITDTVRQNADNAQQANQLSSSARDNISAGDKVIVKTTDSMNEINRSSKQVADIITVIDEIAFQTNLLALNAAVEAARAGEQGRGFAVVATEVRNLAQRSASSAKEIKRLVQDSLAKVDNGSALVTQSGQTLHDISISFKKVSDIIAEIAAASQEQSAGILQVNKAVIQMDEMTQQNAALVEELSTNSNLLRDQINILQDLINFFTYSAHQSMPSVVIKKASIPKPHIKRSRVKETYRKHSTEEPHRQDDDKWDEF
ncbi:methyl-accepting chemotaxis protein [Thioflexithrix psekupsensis]|uniref:Methyl-accepting transducer domain-containing protein n=1 Tax=Thioflexithrix psekupsensis TaxID=1570016 RepID=A0A251XAM6_9GAMM|nr:methyl-accepting chemotaxis protein [Thioflexithrix psekupsensis]OUD15419.1 hypothetical protein TPSD3_02505 [Thioflexithrix psekupsensis]